jgi:predicted glutamine amidotransferase
MCGIAGYITDGKTDYRHQIATAVMAKHMAERGGHAWGWFSATHTQHGLGHITQGMAVQPIAPQSFALHTRYGTTGKNTLANAHPFTIAGTLGTVVGIHNGIISNHAELNATHKRNCAVDSQHIFHAVANGQTLNDLEGYGAIVYSLNGVWHIGRFNEGEMSAALTDAGVFFASTKTAVSEALSLAGITVIKWLNIRNNSVYVLTAAGIKKVYKVAATGTRKRWDDALKGSSFSSFDDDLRWTDYYVPTRKRHKDSALTCELCLADTRGDLYELDDQFVCAECFAAITDKLPSGYVEDAMECSSYSFATR